ncbi:MAG: lysylphosphatidylglycerol synthase transmembrane domain-containing protein [Thermomicrobiales bacterium]
MLTPTSTVADKKSAPISAPSAGGLSPSVGSLGPDQTATDLPSLLRRRALSPHTLVSFAIAVALLWFVTQRLNVDLAAIWAQIRQASPPLLATAFVLWYGAFSVRGWRWGRMIDAAGFDETRGYTIPPTRGLAEIIVLAYFANSLVPAKLGDAYRAYLLRREGGVPLSSGFGTILAERFVDAMMLVVVLAGSALVVFGNQLPEQARPALLLGAFLLGAGLCGLFILWLTRDTVVRFLPARVQGVYARLQSAIFGSLRRPALVLGIGLLLWFGDGMRVWFVARSLDAGISPAVAILIAVMGALLTVVPFTPAGLGVVELGIGSVLVAVLGVDPVVAGSIILLDRVVAYWSLLVVGAILFARRTRRDYRGAAATVPPQA